MRTLTIDSALRRAWVYYSKIVRLEEADIHGMCICVTSGARHKWDSGQIDAGHFLNAHGLRSTMKFCRDNVHAQSKTDNTIGRVAAYRPYAAGKMVMVAAAYHQWMLENYGQHIIDGLKRRQNESMNWDLDRALAFRDLCRHHLSELEAERAESIEWDPVARRGEFSPVP